MILASAYPFTGNGLGGLSDSIEAIVTHEINGTYELMFRYPISGLHYADLANGKIVMAKPDDLTDAQPFRIYRITKPLNGVVSVYARHFCYDMQGIIVEPFSATSLTDAFTKIPSYCTPSSPVTLQTTRTVATGMELKEPRPLWKLLGGQTGSLLDTYGGEWDFDKDTAKLVTTLGTDRGVSVRYGKNMTSLEQDGTIESTYSAVYPYWYDEESNTLVTLTEKYVTVTGSIVSNRILCLDCSDDFDSAPTEQNLRDKANAYISNNSVGSAKTSWKISFVDEFLTEKVMLGDVLHVYYTDLGVNATARAVKTEYDVLNERYKSITVGRVKQNLASIIVSQNEETTEKIKTTKSFLEKAIDDATYSITHGGGEFRFIYNGFNVKEIVSLDDPDITLAQSVWRWNNGGFGHSSTGYNGNYTLALLPDGSINASVITTGTLNADIIRAGIIADIANKNSWDLSTGALTITDGSINIDTNSASDDRIRLNYASGADEYGSQMGPHGFGVNYTDGNFYYDSGLQPMSVSFSLFQGNAPISGNELNSASYNWSGADVETDTDKTYLTSLGVDVYGRTNWTNDYLLAEYRGSEINYYDSNGNQTAQYPNGVDFSSEPSVYSSRGTIGSIICRKWGNFRFINIEFTASYTGTTSTEKIMELGANNAPSIEAAVSCVDTTSGTGYVDSYVPCKVSPNGSIFMNHATNGHRYIITGFYYVSA